MKIVNPRQFGSLLRVQISFAGAINKHAAGHASNHVPGHVIGHAAFHVVSCCYSYC